MQPGISWYIFLGKLILDDIVKKKKSNKDKENQILNKKCFRTTYFTLC